MTKNEINIHKWLAGRMVLSWIIMSIILAGVIYLYNLKAINNSAAELAIEEAAHLKDHYEKSKGLKDSLASHMDEAVKVGHFVNVELYDINKEMIYITSLEDYAFLEKFAEEHDHSDLFKDSVKYSKKVLDGESYIFVIAPIKDENKVIEGYFEGIFHVDSAVFADIYNQIFYSILIVIVALASATLLFYPIILRLNNKIIKHSETLLASNLKMLEILGTATEKRDYDTNDHNIRVTLLATMLGEAYGIRKNKLRGVIKGSMLHDVGKIGIPDNILLKNGKLDSGEMDIMREHVTHGVEIIENHRWLEDALDIIECHHEWYNGEGYMKGLKGDDIPIGARLFAVVDVFDALLVKRPYKEPYSFEATMSIMEKKKGTHFDPKVFDAFAGNVKVFHAELYDKDVQVLDRKMDHIMAKYFRTTNYSENLEFIQ